MQRLLLVVEDAFTIPGLFVLLMPEVDPKILGDVDYAHGHVVSVRFKRPDKTEHNIKLTVSLEHFQGSVTFGGWRYIATWRDGTKDDVPIGTEVWLLDAP